MAKRKKTTSSGGNVSTNYGYFVEDGVTITFTTDNGLTTGITGTVVTPWSIKGQKCVKTDTGWHLVPA